MVQIYDQSLTDATLSFKVSAPGTLRYQIDGTASYATAALMAAAAGSAEITGTVAAPVGSGVEVIDTSGLANGAWYIHLVQSAGTDSVPVSVSFTKIADNVIVANVAGLTLTGFPVTITRNINVLATNAGAMTLTGLQAVVSQGANTDVAANAASLTLTGATATVRLDRNVNAAVRALTLTGLGATVTNPASGGFSPADLFAASEAGAWYDPSDLSTLWQDTAGTTPVTADGQAVARIDDKSGNGNHLTQATAANRPLYKTAGTLHWLEFDGVNDWHDMAGDGWFSQTVTNVVMGVRPDELLGTIIGNRGTDGRILSARSGPTLIVSHIGKGTATVSGISTGTDYVVYADGNAGGDPGIAVNGGTKTVTGAIYFEETTNGTQVGNDGRGASGDPMQMRLYGLVGRGVLLSTTERADTEAWLAAKSGVTL